VKRAGLLAGVLVALVAALASYTHMRELAASNGETWLSWLIPLSVDGLLVVASLVIVAARRSGDPAPLLAWLALVVGVLASLAANVANAGDGLVAKLVAGWPPLAFAVTFELVLRLVRTEGVAIPDTPGGEVVSADSAETKESAPLFGDVTEKSGEAPGGPGETLVTLARDLVATAEVEGRKVGRATLARQLGISEHQARQVLRQLDAEKRPALRVAGGEHQ
jgi:hypothetical protein